MPKFLFRIGSDANGPCLYPDHDRGRAWIKRQEHEFVEMECKSVRSPEQLRAYWGRLNRVYANLPEAWQNQIPNANAFHARTKCALGHCDRYERGGNAKLKGALRTIAASLRSKGMSGFASKIDEAVNAMTVVIEVPHSVAIGHMSHDDFNEFFTSATELWAKTLGVTPDDLRAQDYMDGPEIGI